MVVVLYRTGSPDADTPDSSVCKSIWARGTHGCHMRGYYPRVSLKILPDSGGEPPQEDNVIRMCTGTIRTERGWLRRHRCVVHEASHAGLYGPTGRAHNLAPRADVGILDRGLIVSPSTRSGLNSHTFTVSILSNLFLLCSCPLPRRVISSSLPRKASPLPASPAPPTPKAQRARQSVLRSTSTRSHPVHRATTRPGCCIA